MDEKARQEKLTKMNNTIRFWESMLFHNKAFLPVSTVTLIEQTITFLEELRDQI